VEIHQTLKVQVIHHTLSSTLGAMGTLIVPGIQQKQGCTSASCPSLPGKTRLKSSLRREPNRAFITLTTVNSTPIRDTRRISVPIGRWDITEFSVPTALGADRASDSPSQTVKWSPLARIP